MNTSDRVWIELIDGVVVLGIVWAIAFILWARWKYRKSNSNDGG
jgi:hypothetical protein